MPAGGMMYSLVGVGSGTSSEHLFNVGRLRDTGHSSEVAPTAAMADKQAYL